MALSNGRWRADQRSGAMQVLNVEIEWAEQNVTSLQTALEEAADHLASLRRRRDELVFEATGEWP